MNRYKKELMLQGYSNMPTIKNLIHKKTGKVLKRIDNIDINNLKSALIDEYRVYPMLRIDFSFKYTSLLSGKVYHNTKWDTKYTNIVDRKKILDEIRRIVEKNVGIKKLFSHFDKNDNAVYFKALQTCSVKLSVKY